MNSLLQAQSAYRSQIRATGTWRGIEYDAFARITHRLKVAGSHAPRGFAELAAALHANRQLWSILAADVAGSGNRLPPELRAQIMYLAEFTRLHSGKVLRNSAPVDPLVDINTAIMRGLGADGRAA